MPAPVIVAGGGGGGGGGMDTIYPPFTPGANDDNFGDGSFTGWTAVNTGTQIPTIIESNNFASIIHPGGGTPAFLWAYLKAYTPAVNDYIEIAFRWAGISQNYNRMGLIMADGVTFGAGNQTLWLLSPSQNIYVLTHYTGFNTDSGTFTAPSLVGTLGNGAIFMRLKYEGSNHFRGYISPDGVSWINVTPQVTSTLTPTRIGFFITPYGGASPLVMSNYYFKQAA